MASKRQILSLYKCLLNESKKFPSYNFRNYAVRKIKDSFKANRNLSDPSQIMVKMQEAKTNLEIIRRQVMIGQMYSTDKLVIENVHSIRVNL
ncbi:PREDICTED: LYR motif-containing protein 4 [Nicrophorus vespilloides]|uniref:LYR motif-containing protein 4 n=1 Tax=Nicrophorus vespilloides TaxID=110193 RepID=A0ABM1MSD6_NICVS|nr:PREDICTED: LYR motif-containing protein 4 [Nicrophorus vespilloides]